MAAYDDINVKSVFIMGIGSIVVTAVSALAVQVLYYTMAEMQQAETQAASNYLRQNTILQEQSEQVSRYGVDETTGNIVIPVDKAIELMVGSEKADDADSHTDAEPHTDKEPSDET